MLTAPFFQNIRIHSPLKSVDTNRCKCIRTKTLSHKFAHFSLLSELFLLSYELEFDTHLNLELELDFDFKSSMWIRIETGIDFDASLNLKRVSIFSWDSNLDVECRLQF